MRVQRHPLDISGCVFDHSIVMCMYFTMDEHRAVVQDDTKNEETCNYEPNDNPETNRC